MANIGIWKEKDFLFLCDSLHSRYIKTKCKCPWCNVRFVLVFALSYIGWEGTGWIDLAQDRNKWWAVVNMVMNLWVQ
jgi:hypothetical protein